MTPAQDSPGLVVVGAGIAALSAVTAFRRAGSTDPVTVIGAEPLPAYHRPAVSKDLVRGTKTADASLVRPAQWYADHDVTLLTGVEVTALDVAARTVSLEDGRTLPYDRVLIATGGRARTLGGVTGPRIRTLRTAQDAADLVVALAGVQEVLVIGAGLVGSEIAASLRALDREVTLLETAALPLARLLPPELGQRYVHLHKDRGTSLETSVEVVEVREDADGVTVVAADGRTWSAGLAVVAIGTEPDTALARAAGLEIADDGGIAVDWLGRTSAPGVYAAGDVASRPCGHVTGRVRGEHWQAAQNHGAAVGAVLAGEETPFDEVPWSWSEQYGVNLQVTGWPEPDGELIVRGSLEDERFTAFSLRGDVLRGAVTVGRPADVRAARGLVAQRARVDRARLADPDVPVGETVVP